MWFVVDVSSLKRLLVETCVACANLLVAYEKTKDSFTQISMDARNPKHEQFVSIKIS